MTDLETGVMIGMLLNTSKSGGVGEVQAVEIFGNALTVLVDDVVNMYCLNLKTITETVTIKSGDTTTTKSFSADIVESVQDSDGNYIYNCTYSDKNKLLHIADKNEKIIYVTKGG